MSAYPSEKVIHEGEHIAVWDQHGFKIGLVVDEEESEHGTSWKVRWAHQPPPPSAVWVAPDWQVYYYPGFGDPQPGEPREILN